MSAQGESTAVRRSSAGFRFSVIGMMALVATGVVGVTYSNPSQAAVAEAVQIVGVTLKPDSSIDTMESRTAVRDKDGKVAADTKALDPAKDADKLPVRVSVAYWLGNQTGTNLADIKGKSGRITIQVTVQDLTALPEEVAYEYDGARYHQTDLVGVPLTVAMSTNLGQPEDTSVVIDTNAAGADAAPATPTTTPNPTTNGVLGRNANSDWVVQWAALLAPPLMAPTAAFTLTLDTTNFVPPAFDLSVQPGLHLDPSIRDLLTGALSTDGDMGKLQASSIQLVADVSKQADAARQFVQRVHDALTRDAEQMGASTYAELKQTSTDILSRLTTTEEQLNHTRTSVAGQIDTTQKTLALDLTAMLADIGDNILGSRPPDSDYTAGGVAGCDLALPQFANPDGNKTLAQTIGLVDRQLGVLVRAFENTGVNNCRSALVSQMEATLGVGPNAPPCDPHAPNHTVACLIDATKDRLSTGQNGLPTAITDSVNQVVNDTNALVLASQVKDLSEKVDQLRQDLFNLPDNLEEDRATLNRDLEDLKTRVTDVRDVVETTKNNLTDLNAQLAGTRALFGAAKDNITNAVGPLQTELNSIAGTSNTHAIETATWALATGTLDAIRAVHAGCLEAVGLGAAHPTYNFNQLTTRLQDVPAHAADCPDPQPQLASAFLEAVTSHKAALDEIGTRITDNVLLLRDLQTASTQITTALEGPDGLDAEIASVANAADALADLFRPSGPFDSLITLIDTTRDSLNLGNLQTAITTLNTVREQLTTLQGDVRPLGTTPNDADCQTALARPVPPAGALLDRVIDHSNKLTCRSLAWPGEVPAYFTSVQEALAAAQTQASQARTATASAVDTTRTQIAAISDQLVGALAPPNADGTTQTLVARDYGKIDAAKQMADARLTAALAAFGESSTRIVASLTDQLSASTANVTASRDLLGRDFVTLMSNLGDPGTDSRTGLLGKLRDIAGQVGDASDVLAALVRATTTYGNDRVTDLRRLNFKAAELTAAQKRLADYPAFAGAPDNVPTVMTAFTFHLATP